MTTVNDTVNPFPTQSPPSGRYGAEVTPNGPLQDMFASIDTITGSVHTRDDHPNQFTGGTGGRGIGGVAQPPSPIADPTGGPRQDVP